MGEPNSIPGPSARRATGRTQVPAHDAATGERLWCIVHTCANIGEYPQRQNVAMASLDVVGDEGWQDVRRSVGRSPPWEPPPPPWRMY